MSIKTDIVEIKKEELVDDISSNDTDKEILNKLLERKRKKAQEKEEEKSQDVGNAGDDVESDTGTEEGAVRKDVSIRMGVVGSGQAGSRIAEQFYNLGYDAIAINTAPQDLQFINMPKYNKLLLEHGLGGAAKDLEIGYSAADAYREKISDIVDSIIGDSQMILFCTSLGGGSGAGSAEVIVDVLSQTNKPIAVITVLPQSSDDAQTKQNSLITLSKFAKMAQERIIDNLIVVDNAKIESIYADVSQMSFFEESNKAIVNPIDVFNTLSSRPSQVKGLDPTEFGKLFTDGNGLTTYGCMDVYNYEDVDALADAIIDNLDGSLLAGGFDLKQTRYAGIIFAAPQRVWDKIPQASTTYAKAMVNDACGTPIGVFHGIYVEEMDEDVVKVYSMFSGLGLPENRVSQLKSEAKEKMAHADEKDSARNLSLKLDTGDSAVSEAERIRNRIKAKKSSFGKLHGNAIDRRR